MKSKQPKKVTVEFLQDFAGKPAGYQQEYSKANAAALVQSGIARYVRAEQAAVKAPEAAEAAEGKKPNSKSKNKNK